ncbi:urease accessory protein UreF, partial [Teratosphaeria nubilosa]
HPLLLLSDSALPLGSFAFSSGLESHLAHTTPHPSLPTFQLFLHHTLTNTASTSLPYVLAAHQHAPALANLDNDFDASTLCAVARRASISQGRALLAVWERAFAGSGAVRDEVAGDVLGEFGRGVKVQAEGLQGHFAPVFGVVCRAMGVGEGDAAEVFLWGHVRAVLSAGVRAGVVGPYQSQAVLASGVLAGWVKGCVEREAGKGIEEAGVSVPVLDVWTGRHELLYSRIFNS